MRTLSIIALFILNLTICQGQTKSAMESLVASDLKFRSTFGFKPADNENVFSLLGNGFFGTPKSEESDSLIRAWIKRHPNATVVPVSSFSPAKIADKISNMIYCWIIDRADTLNIHLIRNGCFPGASMRRPATWEEMTNEEREGYKNGKKPMVNVYVDQTDYKIFLRQIESAEKLARKNDLGIWNEDKQ